METLRRRTNYIKSGDTVGWQDRLESGKASNAKTFFFFSVQQFSCPPEFFWESGIDKDLENKGRLYDLYSWNFNIKVNQK